MPRLQIVRGLPGSGKSTLAHRLWPHLLILEFDQFCMRGGAYAWTPEINERGQLWLHNRIVSACAADIDFVVADVCAGNAADLSWIVRHATQAGYSIYLKTLEDYHGSVHGVRREDIEEMRATMRPDREVVREFPNVHLGCMPNLIEVVK